MRARSYWSIVVLILVVAAMALYLNSQRQLLAALYNISVAAILYLVILRLLFLATNGLFLREFASKFGIRLAVKEWFGLAVITTMGNYITPFSGGLIARATYLKHRHAFPYAQFATLLASNYLVNFWVIGVVAILVLLATQFHWQIAVFFSLVVIVISLLVVLPAVRLPWGNRLARLVNAALEGWTLVKSDSNLLARLVAYTLVNILANGLSFWVAYDALGYSLSFGGALLISLLAAFSILVNVTPGNLGIQEAVVSLSSGLLGAGSGQGLLAALLIRAATLVSAFSLGPIFSLLLTKELTTSQPTDIVPVLDMEPRDDAGACPDGL
jgi:uncharacterized membrane protein YbhN (UPF0104 family)